MSFSRSQQPEFRGLVAAAWQAHCKATATDLKSPGKRAWYEAELFAAVSHYSTTECNAGRDYDFAMAHFEELAEAGIKWQLRKYSGDAIRILWELRTVAMDHDIDEIYLRGVARRMLKSDTFPELHLLPREQLIQILGEVKRFCRRTLKRALKSGAIDIPL